MLMKIFNFLEPAWSRSLEWPTLKTDDRDPHREAQAEPGRQSYEKGNNPRTGESYVTYIYIHSKDLFPLLAKALLVVCFHSDLSNISHFKF